MEAARAAALGILSVSDVAVLTVELAPTWGFWVGGAGVGSQTLGAALESVCVVGGDLNNPPAASVSSPPMCRDGFLSYRYKAAARPQFPAD